MGLFVKNSLRADIEAQIQNDHSDIASFHFSRSRKFKNQLFSRDGYWLVVPFVIILLFVFAFRMPFLDIILFEKATAATIIDQRASNVATIISMTLAVIGLLLGNMAIKDAKSYRLLFLKSRMYFIIYYTLTVIVCLVVVSTLRNTLSTDWFYRLVLSGTYLAISIPVAIAYLFRTIIKFASSDSIMDNFKQLYLDEVKAKLFLQLLSNQSKAAFLELMQECKILKYEIDWNMGDSGEGKSDIEDITITDATANVSETFFDTPEKLIHDLNLPKLREMLNKHRKGEQHYYTAELSINTSTAEHQNFIWPIPKDKWGRKVDFSKCLTLKDPSNQLKVISEYEDYFNDKMEEYLRENKSKKVKEVLAFYEGIYELQMKYA